MEKKYDVFLGKKKVRSCLRSKDSKMVAGSLRAGQAIKKLQGKKVKKVKRSMSKKCI